MNVVKGLQLLLHDEGLGTVFGAEHVAQSVRRRVHFEGNVVSFAGGGQRRERRFFVVHVRTEPGAHQIVFDVPDFLVFGYARGPLPDEYSS